MKDSQDDWPHTLETTSQFPGFHVFSGSDSILTEALAGGAAARITALANVTSPLNRAVWDAHQNGGTAPGAQKALVRARQVIKGLSGPAAMKAALANLFGFPVLAGAPAAPAADSRDSATRLTRGWPNSCRPNRSRDKTRLVAIPEPRFCSWKPTA